MTAGGIGAPEADTSRAARTACLEKGLWVTYVRWTTGAQVCGCQLAYRLLPPTACIKLQEAVDDVAALMGWCPDWIKHEKLTNGPFEDRPPGTSLDTGHPGNVGIPCLCGCGSTTNRGSFYMPGHDARLRSYVRQVNSGKMGATVLKVAMDYGAIVKRGDTYHLMSVAIIREGVPRCRFIAPPI